MSNAVVAQVQFRVLASNYSRVHMSNRGPVVPRERHLTIRQELMRLLEGDAVSIGFLSREMGKPEKEIYDYLRQLNETKQLSTVPPTCIKCGYTFANRRRVTKPSRCPRCKSTHISQPQYSLRMRPARG